VTENDKKRKEKKRKENTLLNLEQRYMVKACNDLLFHPIDCHCMLYDLKTKFCCFLVLFDKVEFAMVFG